MKEITIRRDHQNFAMMNFKIFIGNGQPTLIGNGETKKIQLDEIPSVVYAKQGWVKSKNVTVDNSTTELILKNNKTKNWLASKILGLFILTALLPKMILDDSSMAKTMSIIGLFIILIWALYIFVIKRDDWIIIDKKTS